MRLALDSICFCLREMPRFHAYLEDTYFISDGGLDAGTPDGGRVYVDNRGSGTVSVIDTEELIVVATIGVGSSPFGVAVNATRAYVPNNVSGNVSVIGRTPAIAANLSVSSESIDDPDGQP